MLISKIKKVKEDAYLNDSGTAVLTLYEKYGGNLIKMMRESDHGKILLENGFESDLEYCSIIDMLDVIPVYTNGVLKKLKSN
jgi:2-phosphosulfolactate phosphatase